MASICLWVLGLPWAALFTLTIPDVKKERCRKLFVMTFLLVLVWLGCMAYGMVWCATRFAKILGIPEDVMGVSVTAIGASLPSLFGSVIAARMGLANMAISNAFGANLCSILIAFGLPCFIFSAAVEPLQPYICESGAIFTAVLVLFIALIVFIIVTAISRLKLNRIHGVFFLLLYVVLLTVVVIFELLHIDIIPRGK